VWVAVWFTAPWYPVVAAYRWFWPVSWRRSRKAAAKIKVHPHLFSGRLGAPVVSGQGQAAGFVDVVQQFIPGGTTTKGKERRKSQLTWQTCSIYLKKKQIMENKEKKEQKHGSTSITPSSKTSSQVKSAASHSCCFHGKNHALVEVTPDAAMMKKRALVEVTPEVTPDARKVDSPRTYKNKWKLARKHTKEQHQKEIKTGAIEQDTEYFFI
jgi:hypothetical protein